jgi:hypothetical protein
VHIDCIQRLVKRTVVERQRANEKGAARECHDADPVAIQLPGHVIDSKLRPRQPVGFDIWSQHAPRRVDCENHLVAAAADPLPVIAELRARERREKTQGRA